MSTAVADKAKEQAIKGALEAGRPAPSDAQLEKIIAEAEGRSTFGFDAKKDRRGNFIQQGIGAPGHENNNHFTALKKRELQGFEPKGAYEAAVAEIWKRDPKHAAALSLPKPVKGAAP